MSAVVFAVMSEGMGGGRSGDYEDKLESIWTTREAAEAQLGKFSEGYYGPGAWVDEWVLDTEEQPAPPPPAPRALFVARCEPYTHFKLIVEEFGVHSEGDDWPVGTFWWATDPETGLPRLCVQGYGFSKDVARQEAIFLMERANRKAQEQLRGRGIA